MAVGHRGSTMRGMTTYRIVIDGELSDRFVATFGEMRLARRAGETWLTGEIADQAQLQGLITRVADLGLSLLSVAPVVPDPEGDLGPDGPDHGAASRAATGGAR